LEFISLSERSSNALPPSWGVVGPASVLARLDWATPAGSGIFFRIPSAFLFLVKMPVFLLSDVERGWL
jgi:hypothetical protein